MLWHKKCHHPVGLVMMGLGLQPFEILNISSVQDCC